MAERGRRDRALPRPPAVARVLERVVATSRRHRMFEPGSPVVVAVSGGADSVCLLHALARLRGLLRIDPLCFHFDHHLRGGSEADARYVRGQAERLGLRFVMREADSRPARGESMEAWARVVRYEALRAVAEEVGGVAAVAHTADDQAETVLLALLRGGGLEAVGAMAPVNRPIVRPLLDVTREATHAFCRSLGLRPRRDPMNEDPRFMRVALRRALPSLERALGRGVRDALVRSSAHLRRDAEFLDELAIASEPEVVRADGSGALLHAARLGALAPAIGSRIVRRALFSTGALPGAEHIEAVLDLAAGAPGKRVELPGGLLAKREREYVRLIRPSPRQRRAVRASRPAGDRPGGVGNGESD